MLYNYNYVCYNMFFNYNYVCYICSTIITMFATIPVCSSTITVFATICSITIINLIVTIYSKTITNMIVTICYNMFYNYYYDRYNMFTNL